MNNWNIFFDLESFLLVVGIIIITLCLKRGDKIYQRVFTGSLFAALLGPIIGYIMMLDKLSDPSLIGEGVALSLLSFLYGICIALLVYVFSRIRAKGPIFFVPIIGLGLVTNCMFLVGNAVT